MDRNSHLNGTLIRGVGAVLAGAALMNGGVALGQEAHGGLRLAGVAVTPHVQSREMRWRREADFSLGARVELFVLNADSTERPLSLKTPVRLRGKTPAELVAGDEWAWHDFPSAWTHQPMLLPSAAWRSMWPP